MDTVTSKLLSSIDKNNFALLSGGTSGWELSKIPPSPHDQKKTEKEKTNTNIGREKYTT